MLGVVAQQGFRLAANLGRDAHRALAPRLLHESQQLERRGADVSSCRFARAAGGAQHAAQQRREVVAIRLDRRPAAHAFAQLRPVAERFQQPEMEHDEHHARVVCRAKAAQALDQRVEHVAVFQPVFGQQVDHFGQVIRVRGQLEVLADLPEGFERVRLRDHVQLAADGEHHVAQGEGLEVACRTAGGAANALGDRANLANIAGKKGNDAVRLAQVRTLQDHRGGAVQAAAGHYVLA